MCKLPSQSDIWNRKNMQPVLLCAAGLFSDSRRQLTSRAESSPLSTSALSLYLPLKVSCWPSPYYHVTFPNNRETTTERRACGEFPPEASLSLSAPSADDTPTCQPASDLFTRQFAQLNENSKVYTWISLQVTTQWAASASFTNSRLNPL